MDHLMPFWYVSFSYLSKVKIGGKVVHGTLTLSQDPCSHYEPMHPTQLSSLLLSCPYLKIGLGNWVGGTDENANYRGTYAQIFLSAGLSFFLAMRSWSKVLFGYFIISPSPTPTLCDVCGKYDGLHLSTQNYT